MVSTRLTGRASFPIAAGLSAVLMFSSGSCTSSVSTPNARADETKADETDSDFVVPDGTPAQILAYVKKLENRKKKYASHEEFVEDAIKIQRALITASEKLLSQKIDDKVAEEAVQMQLSALTRLAVNEVGDSAKDALAAVTKFKADERKGVAKAAEQFWLPIRIANLRTMSDDERHKVTDEVVESVRSTNFSKMSTDAAQQLAETLALMNRADDAGKLYDQLASISAEAKDAKFRKNAEIFTTMARRIRLPGNFMEVDGKLLDGSDFDWTAYRGKVVLVDFWATWCGPCVAEIPNVKQIYKKYHDKGFDVVGISLDNARLALEKFVEKEELPWPQLYDETRQRGNGWNNTVAKRYGINGIPAAFLVDKEGKVVSMSARGEELQKLVEKLLGPAE